MLLRSILEAGLPEISVYAPRFRVSISGRAIDFETLSDVLQLKVTMQKKGITDFSMTLNNWDENVTEFPKFKYSDSDTFRIGTELFIEMGYGDQLIPMMTGQITSLTPKFPSSGAPTVEVSGVNRISQLKNSKPLQTDKTDFTQDTDAEIAEYIAGKHSIAITAINDGAARVTTATT